MKNVILILALGLPSCGDSNSSGTPPAAVSAPDLALVVSGSFQSECKYMSRLTMKNNGSLSEIIIKEYTDDLCQHPKVSTKVVRTAANIKKVDDSNYYLVDLTYVSIDLTVEDDSIISSNLYGFTDWKVGEAKSVMGLPNHYKAYNATIPTKDQTYYQAWSFDGTTFKIESPAWTMPTGKASDKDHRNMDLLTTVDFTKA